MSPNGSLVAYSTPANIKQVRDQAAFVSMILKDHVDAAEQDSTQDHGRGSFAAIRALTVEVDTYTIIARPAQANLLLVLAGRTTPNLHRQFHITVEKDGDASIPQSSIDEGHTANDVGAKLDMPLDEYTTALQMQRKKVDLLVEYIRDELKNISMPDDATYAKPL